MVLPSQEAPAARCIKEGELVVVYENYNSIKFVYVDPKAQYNNRYGSFAQKVAAAAAAAVAAAAAECPGRPASSGISGSWRTLLTPLLPHTHTPARRRTGWACALAAA